MKNIKEDQEIYKVFEIVSKVMDRVANKEDPKEIRKDFLKEIKPFEKNEN